MSGEQGLEQQLADYAVLLRGQLPGAVAAAYFGPDGRLMWRSDPAADLVPPGPAMSALRGLLATGTDGDCHLVQLAGACNVLLISLGIDRGQGLGVLAIRLEGTDARLSAEAGAAQLRPVVRTLQRELSLRLRLLEGIRKLAVQAAEEQLLLQVETLGHARGECLRLAGTVLSLCRRYLQVSSAALLVPAKGIEITDGEAISPTEANLILADAVDKHAAGEPLAVHTAPDLVAMPVRSHGMDPQGLLLLGGWGSSPFSIGRRSRIARYIASHIESLLDRDYDALTGLPAWEVFECWLAEAQAEGDGERHTVMYLDLDQLHVANDTLGRDIGDEVIRRFAQFISEELAGHRFTRITGDSFAALLRDTTPEQAIAHAEALCARLGRLEYRRSEQVYRPSVSIGIGPLNGNREDGGDALGAAQVACQAAKDRGRGRIEVYHAEDISIVQRLDDIQLVGYVRSAIDRDRMLLLGQPIVPVRGGQGRPYYEVLLRLLDDDDRRVSPGEFFSAAERYRLMQELDQWVVRETLRHLAELRFGGGPMPRIAINLSGQSLGSEEFLPFLLEQIRGSGVPPDMLCFEITETVAVANLQRAQNLMHTLRQMGCHFSLDDFGTGLSSFAYLKLFPVDTLKIDGSFIRDLASNRVSQSVVAAIAEVARVNEYETVAEYVEDQDALAMLGRLGITWAQGFLVGEPVLLTDCIRTLATGDLARMGNAG